MEYLSAKLTIYLLEKKVIHDKDFAIYQYGFQCFLELFISTICSIIIGISLHMIIECALFFIFFIPMRSLSGGLHLDTYFSCLCSSCLILFFTLLGVKYLPISSTVSFILYLFSIVGLILIGPIDHPNRKVLAKENRVFIKRTNHFLLLSFFIAITLLILKSTRILLLEAIVFLFLCLTALLGKLKYQNTQ